MSVSSVSKAEADNRLEFRKVQVTNIESLTERMTKVSFRAEGKPGLSFQPGQFVILRALIDGEDVRRAYSLCGSCEDTELHVGIKHIEGGVFSGWVKDTLRVGDTLEVLPPDGRFLGEEIDLTEGDYVGIAAGSGITPIMSILRSVLQENGASRFTLFYGNRSATTVAFRTELHALKNKFMDRLRLVHVLSRESGEVELTNGRLDGDRLKTLLSVFSPQTIDRAFICGPDEMMFAARDVLLERGMDAENIRIESFGDFAPQTEVDHRSDAPQSKVAMTMNGRTSNFDMYTDETILEGGRRAGADLPFACKGGVCATCRCRVSEGKAKMLKNYALTPKEVSEGWILSCQALPETDAISVSFDN